MALRYSFFAADGAGAGVGGLAPTVETWRTAAGGAPSDAQPSLTELDATNAVGWYYFDLDVQADTLIGIDFTASAASVKGPAGHYSGTRRASAELKTTDAAFTSARLASLDELGGSNLPADVDTLIARLTATRAGNLDEITGTRLAELDPANMPAGVAGAQAQATTAATQATAAAVDAATLDGRLTAGRAANLDEITSTRLAQLDAGNVPADAATAATQATAAAADAATIESRLTAGRSANLDKIDDAISNVAGNVWDVAVGVPTVGSFGEAVNDQPARVFAFSLGEFDAGAMIAEVLACCRLTSDNVWQKMPAAAAAPNGSFGWLLELAARIAGKVNVVVDPGTFDGVKMEDGAIRVYRTLAHADLDNPANAIATISLAAVYDGSDNLDKLTGTEPG